MIQVIESEGQILEGLVTAEGLPAGARESEISKLMALMHQASKTRYIIRTIPACNSDS